MTKKKVAKVKRKMSKAKKRTFLSLFIIATVLIIGSIPFTLHQFNKSAPKQEVAYAIEAGAGIVSEITFLSTSPASGVCDLGNTVSFLSAYQVRCLNGSKVVRTAPGKQCQPVNDLYADAKKYCLSQIPKPTKKIVTTLPSPTWKPGDPWAKSPTPTKKQPAPTTSGINCIGKAPNGKAYSCRGTCTGGTSYSQGNAYCNKNFSSRPRCCAF